MDIQHIIDQFSDKLVASMGALPGELSKELHKNSKVILQSALSRLDIVTREEFDAQTAVLKRSREKLEQLEQQFVELSQQAN